MKTNTELVLKDIQGFYVRKSAEGAGHRKESWCTKYSLASPIPGSIEVWP